MKNRPIGARERQDLDEQVARVLREIGTEPPLELALVRDLLKLDRHYFSSTDTGYLQDTISRVRRAGKQIFLRPTLILDAVRKADLKALWLPDKKRILIDSEVPELKKRWAEGHEIGHSLAPWHRGYLLGDDRFTLSARCQEELENEANYASGQLLFCQDRFVAEARSVEPSLNSIWGLAKTYRNTRTTTLCRFAETLHDTPVVAIVSPHPRHHGEDFDPDNPCKYVIESEAFRNQFSTAVSELALFEIIAGYSSWKRGGPLGETETILMDVDGAEHVFQFETFFNRYEALTLGVYLRPAAQIVTVGAGVRNRSAPRHY